MAKLRMRNGEFIDVREEYEEARKRFSHAVTTGEAFVLTLDGGVEITINPAGVDFIRPD